MPSLDVHGSEGAEVNEMAASNLLLLLGAVGLATGCVAGGPSARDAERPPIYSPAPTRAGAPKVPADRMPESPPNAAIPRASSPAPHRPPAVIELGSPRTSVEMARADLAHRLDADVALIEVAEASLSRSSMWIPYWALSSPGLPEPNGKPATVAPYNAVIRAGLTFARSQATIILTERWVHVGRVA